MKEPKLRYSDERDKTYGITGMTITLVALDGEEYLSEIHLDSEPGETSVINKSGNCKNSLFVLEDSLAEV